MEDLDEIRGQQDQVAGQIDQAGDQAYAALAAQWRAISPEASGYVLDALQPVLKTMGGELQGEPTTIADPAVVRALSAIADATADAVADDVLPAELAFEPADITDDQAAALVAGKLAQIGKDKGFAKWLQRPLEQAGKPADKGKPKPKPEPKPEEPAGDDDFFASRLKD